MRVLFSYLADCAQCVQVRAKLRDPKPVEPQGVPQVCILGPILFMIFMNDFPENSAIGELILYAEDSTEIVVEEYHELLASYKFNTVDQGQQIALFW